MSETKTSYRQIIKSTSLFGGVQVFLIIISIIRSKIIAVLLGPAGMGIAGLLLSAIGLVSGLTNFGLETSAVKDIAAANESNNEVKISTIVAVINRLVWLTGILGALVTLIAARWLSELTFGNDDYTGAFIWLSVSLIFNQLAIGKNVLLRGKRNLKYLAKANILGSLFGLIVSTPIYFLYEIDGIVPALIISAFITMFIAFYFASKIDIKKASISLHQTWKEGKGMLKLGFILSLSGLIATIASYIVRIYISNAGSVEDVGLYNAGFSIIVSYVGLVFTAMITDYYPKLAGVASDNIKAAELINQQSEMAVLILAPILSAFLIFIQWGIILLYSSEFIPIMGMLHIAALGIYFKAMSWCISILLLAKGASKIYFWSEISVNFYLTLLNVICYKYWGLTGLGLSFFIGYLMYFVQVYVISRNRYHFRFDNSLIRILIVQFSVGVLCFIIVNIFKAPLIYILGIPLILFSSWYSWIEIEKRIDLKNILQNKLSRK